MTDQQPSDLILPDRGGFLGRFPRGGTPDGEQAGEQDGATAAKVQVISRT
jgi:hypothetical protein